MVEQKHDSTRNLLAAIEGDWDALDLDASPSAASPETRAALDAAADRLVDSLDPPPISVPTMDELDSGWGLGEDEEEEEEDEEEDEEELPDAALDPVAYAAARNARDARLEARRERRRAKADAKKARRKARAEAQKQKQKGKSRKARPPGAGARAGARTEAKAIARGAKDAGEQGEPDEQDEQDEPVATTLARARGKTPPSKAMLSKANQRMLAVAIVVFVAAALFAAAVAR
jgi:hypothetical protein